MSRSDLRHVLRYAKIYYNIKGNKDVLLGIEIHVQYCWMLDA